MLDASDAHNACSPLSGDGVRRDPFNSLASPARNFQNL